VAELLGVTAAESVRKGVRQAEVDVGSRPGTGTEGSQQVRRLKAGERRAEASHGAGRVWERTLQQSLHRSVRRQTLAFLHASATSKAPWPFAWGPLIYTFVGGGGHFRW
jgi:hypothetical protein